MGAFQKLSDLLNGPEHYDQDPNTWPDAVRHVQADALGVQEQQAKDDAGPSGSAPPADAGSHWEPPAKADAVQPLLGPAQSKNGADFDAPLKSGLSAALQGPRLRTATDPGGMDATKSPEYLNPQQQKRKAHVSVGMPSAPLTQRPFESLLQLAPSGAPKADPTPAAPAGPSFEERLAAAQSKAHMLAGLANAGDELHQAGYVIGGVKPDSSTYGKGAEAAYQPVKDMLEQRKLKTQDIADNNAQLEGKAKAQDIALKTAANDPNSPASQTLKAYLIAKGAVTPSQAAGLSQAMAADIFKGADYEQTVKNQNAERAHADAQLAQQARLNAGDHAFQAGQNAQERQLRRDLDAANNATKLAEHQKAAAAAKGLSDKETDAIVGQKTALKAVDDLDAAHKAVPWYDGLAGTKVGPVTVPPISQEGATFLDKRHNDAPAIAQGVNSQSRGNVGLIRNAEEGLPTALNSDTRGSNNLANTKATIQKNLDDKLQALRAAGKSSDEINELAGQGQHAAKKPITRTVHGVTKTWNGSAWVD